MKRDTPGIGSVCACPHTLCDLALFYLKARRNQSLLHPILIGWLLFWTRSRWCHSSRLTTILSASKYMPRALPLLSNTSFKWARVPQLKCWNCCLGIADKHHGAMAVILLWGGVDGIAHPFLYICDNIVLIHSTFCSLLWMPFFLMSPKRSHVAW